MNSSLWLLVFLGFRARYRRILRGLATVRGALLMLVGIAFFALMILGPFLARRLEDPGAAGQDAAAAAPIQRFGPAGLLAFALLSLFASAKHRGVYFSPAEVDFLFPGPFARRELIAYRLASIMAHTLLSVVFLSAVFFPHLGGFWRSAAGLFLAFTFIHLVQVAGSLLAGTVEERLVARGRRFISIVLVGFAVIVFAGTSAAVGGGPEIRDRVRDLVGSEAFGWALLPLKVFSETLAAPDLKGFLLWGAGAAAVDLALLLAVLRLDIDYSEASLETSRKIHERLQRMRRGGRIVASSRKLPVSLPLPSRWGGVGPVAWRQATEMLREMPGTVYLLLIFAVCALAPTFFLSGRDEIRLSGIAAGLSGIVFMLPFILSNWFHFDFRGDLDRMELLLGLPVPPFRIALGQVLAPAVILSLLQAAGFALVLAFPQEGGQRTFLQCALFCSFPLNLLFVGIENLFFLIYPARLVPTAPGDFQMMGRIILVTTMKLLAMALVAGLGGLLAYLVLEVLGGSWWIAALAVAGFLVLADGLVLLLVGRAFARFDVSRSPPE